jgi:DNA polymerase/3'-5' exonuclease PolX
MQLKSALKIANRIVELLQPHCEIIHIAGSIRREKPTVKDVEIICIPKKEFIQTDLFGGGTRNVSKAFTESIASITSAVVKGIVQGRYMQVILKGCDGLKMDLFLPEPHDYYRQYAIRTGSADYAHKVIATAWLKKGWCGTPYGLRRQSDCFKNKADAWMLQNHSGATPPAWKSEEEFFTWLDIAWEQPRFRDVADHSFSKVLSA